MMVEIEVLEIGKNCPRCGSSQFSISPQNPDMLPPRDWPEGVLGVSDCPICDGRPFLVRLAPELEQAVAARLKAGCIIYDGMLRMFQPMAIVNWAIEVLFHR